MRTSRKKLEEFLWITGMHHLARSFYNITAGRHAQRIHDGIRRLYGTFLTKGALAFDIGANLGSYAAILSSLGAKVVAVEPNADCVRHIQLSYQGAGIEVIHAVAGPKDGLAKLHLSDERDDISSLSEDWIRAIQREHAEYGGLWAKQVAVPMLRLDTLVEHYGPPAFIKIDVEGFEEHVLDGLSSQPPLLSFEFNLAYLDATLRCLSKPIFAKASRYNFAIGEPVKFALERWVPGEELFQVLSGLAKGDQFGDIFVRLPTV